MLLALAFASQAFCEGPPAWSLWQQYSAHFIDDQGRVVDRQTMDRSTSEAQAYAMFFALVANDRPAFERLRTWTENNLCKGDMAGHLPAWNWGKDKDGSWHTLDANTASDADLWMAYSLLEAGRLWDDRAYLAAGEAVLQRIATEEVMELPGFGPMLMPGRIGFHSSPDVWIVNPSYLPPPVLRGAARMQPHGPWGAIEDGLPLLLKQASPHGFAMDWVAYTQAGGFQPSPAPWEQPGAPPHGSYDAVRVYLWTGLSQAETPNFAVMLGSIIGMAQYMDQHMEPPEVVDANGVAVRPDGGVGFSAALIPYLSKTGRKASATLQRARLDAHLDEVLGLYEKDPRYYDQNLALFALGWSEQRYSFDADGRLKVRWKR